MKPIEYTEREKPFEYTERRNLLKLSVVWSGDLIMVSK